MAVELYKLLSGIFMDCKLMKTLIATLLRFILFKYLYIYKSILTQQKKDCHESRQITNACSLVTCIELDDLCL